MKHLIIAGLLLSACKPTEYRKSDSHILAAYNPTPEEHEADCANFTDPNPGVEFCGSQPSACHPCFPCDVSGRCSREQWLKQYDGGVPPATELVITLEADAQVAEASPTVNYGSLTTVTVDNSPVLHGFIRFNIAGLGGREIQSATLTLATTDSSSDGPALYAAPSAWTESTVTWNTKPTHTGSVIADLGASSSGTTASYNVTSLITGDGDVTFALIPTSSSGFGFSSREGTTPPVLSIVFASGEPDPEGFTFVAVGDIGNNSDASTVLTQSTTHGADFLFMLGDLSYQTPPETVWCDYVKTKIGSFKTIIVSGNHESKSSHGNGLIDNFVAPGCLPNTQANVTGVYGKEFYFDYPVEAPIARFIAAGPNLPFENPTETHTVTVGSTHYNWMAARIDEARVAGIPWVIVSVHFPCITVGEKTCEMGAAYFNLLISKKVDLVLMGHDHTYSRSKQLAHGTGCSAITPNVFDGDCVVDSGADGNYTKDRGPIFVLNGMGGRAADASNTSDPEIGYMANYMGSSITYGVSKITVTPTSLTAVKTRSHGGTFTDTFTITEAP